MKKSVLRHDQDNWCELSLNRAEKLNVLNDEIISELSRALNAIAIDDQIERVYLSGSGPKGFCAGGDVVNVINYSGDQEPGHFFKAEYEVDLMIHRFKKPIISLCHRIIMGGGVGLVNGTSLKVFDQKTLLAMPEITIGLFPDVGSSFFLNQLERKWCLFLAMTGARLSTALSFALELCDYVIARDSWDKLKATKDHSELLELCKELHSCEAIDLSEFSDLNVINDMKSVYEFDRWAREYAQKENANHWIKSSIETYLQGSPLSAKIIWSYFNWAKGKSIEECFAKDLELGRQMLECSDFSEGVRALLIDKDKNPKWMFKELSEISSEVWSKYEALF